jgi:HAE1 family hydrophobic/amphiphilic exporter-1
VLMIVLFALIVGVTAWGFIRQPTGFLPTEDQGYAVLVSILPEGASQPRSRAVADKISALLEKTDGLAGWVTIGGFSVIDFANVPNVSTTFIVYKNWSERGKGLTQDLIVSGLNRDLSGIQEALAFVVIPPPIRGLGQTGGFQMMVEDRRSLGLSELSRNTAELVQKGNASPGRR